MVSKIAKLAFLFVTLLLVFSFVAACGGTKDTEGGLEGAEGEVKPTNPGGPGEAVNLTGNATAGAEVYKTSCASCHGEEGKGGVANTGSTDETVPSLNPIDPGLVSSVAKTYVTNIDLFVEHGSTPEGSGPTLEMTAFGDQKILTSQQIADVIAYVISLNK